MVEGRTSPDTGFGCVDEDVLEFRVNGGGVWTK